MKTSKKAKPAPIITHEAFIASVVALVLKRPELTDQDRKRLSAARITYGADSTGAVRGVTWYGKWRHDCNAHGKRVPGRKEEVGELICIHASGQESVTQLAGTTLHEAAHVIAGVGTGHLHEWKAACARVGLPAAVNGTEYTWDSFAPEMAKAIRALPVPNDGMPLNAQAAVQRLIKLGANIPQSLQAGALLVPKPRPCGAGWGVRGGTSRGKGSGSRHLQYIAEHKDGCDKPAKLRCGFTTLSVSCDNCKAPYVLNGDSLPPSHGMGASGQGVAAATARKAGARKALVKTAASKARAARKQAKRRAKAKGGVVASVHAQARVSPAPKVTPKAARRKAATAGQAPVMPTLATAPSDPPSIPLPQVAGTVDGVEVVYKPAPRMCEACNHPASQCTRPAGECVA